MSKPHDAEVRPEEPRSGGACFLYGCLAVFLGAVLLAVFAGFMMYRFYRGQLEQYTASAPADIPAIELSEEAVGEIKGRIESFQETIEKGGTPGDLVLTADEINALISKDDDLKGRVYVRIAEGQVSGDVSIPTDFIPLGKGRFFNASGTFDVSLADGVLVVTLAGATVKGEPVPQQFVDALSEENFAKEIYNNPDAAKMLRRFESLTIADDKIVLKPRPEGGEPDGMAEDADADDASLDEPVIDLDHAEEQLEPSVP